MTVIAQLQDKLTRELEAIALEIVDDSWRHAGHMEARPGIEATHLSITVVSPRFEGLELLEQHRLVHEALREAREQHLHALQLKTVTPSAWNDSK